MLSNTGRMQQSSLHTFKWPLLAGVVILGAGLFIAIAVVISLIPIYLSVKQATATPVLSPSFTLSYDFVTNESTLSLPIDPLPSATLTLLQNDFQKQLDADSVTTGSQITVASGTLAEDSSALGKRRKRAFARLRLIVIVRIQYPLRCNTPRCRRRLLRQSITVTLAIIFTDFIRIQATIVAGSTIATSTATSSPSHSGASTSTIPASTPGASISYSANPTTIPGRRRRRNIPVLTQTKSYMPIGGCLLIGPEQDDRNITQYLYKRHAFIQYLPLGIEIMPAIDGQEIDSYSFLQQNKLSKGAYNQLITQDHLIGGHYLTMGALGCLEAHVQAWNRVVELNQPMLILEDDAKLHELIDYMLPYLLYSLPTNFSLLYFGNLVGKDMDSKSVDYNGLLWKINGANWGTYAYVISPQAAATLLDFIYPVYAQVDSMMMDIVLSQSLDVFVSKEILVTIDNKHDRVSRVQRYKISPIFIPRILHFIWLLNNSLTAAAQRNLELWKNLHPHWQIQLWTNESIYNSDLVIFNSDRFEHSARSPRQASDIIRYEIINQYGGIYADVDFEPLKSLDTLLHGIDAFVVRENDEFICNGIYGAIPGHELSRRLVDQLDANWKSVENGTVNEQTGPFHMTKQVRAMREENKTSMKERFQIFAPHLFFPYAWYEKDPAHPYDPSAFAVHHFRPIAEIERNGLDRS